MEEAVAVPVAVDRVDLQRDEVDPEGSTLLQDPEVGAGHHVGVGPLVVSEVEAEEAAKQAAPDLAPQVPTATAMITVEGVRGAGTSHRDADQVVTIIQIPISTASRATRGRSCYSRTTTQGME